MMPFIKQEFGLSYTQAGLVSAAFSLSYGISQLPAGYLTDRIGPRIMITISICGIGLSGLLIGLSHSYILMLIFLVLMGISGGGYHPAAPPLLASTVPPAIRGKAFGFHLIGGTGAFFIAPLIGAGIAAAWGWRQSFIGLAIPSLVFGIVFCLIISRVIVKKIETAGAKIDDAHQPSGWKLQLALFIALAAVVSSLSSSASFYTALFAQDRFEISAAVAAMYVSVLNSSGIWASPLGGYLSDRLGHIPALLISCLAAGPIIYLLTIAPHGAGFIIALLAWGALISIRLPTTESYIMSHSSPKLRSTLFGVYYFSTQHGSGILTPILGVLIDHIGFTYSFYILAAATLGATLVIGSFLWRSRTRLVGAGVKTA